jgi:hypothetical protein
MASYIYAVAAIKTTVPPEVDCLVGKIVMSDKTVTEPEYKAAEEEAMSEAFLAFPCNLGWSQHRVHVQVVDVESEDQ